MLQAASEIQAPFKSTWIDLHFSRKSKTTDTCKLNTQLLLSNNHTISSVNTYTGVGKQNKKKQKRTDRN